MMSKIIRLGSIFVFASIFLLTGCHSGSKSSPSSSTNQSATTQSGTVVATVNGKPITLAEYNYYKTTREEQTPNVKLGHKALLAEIVDTELLKQAALKAGMDKQPKIQARIQQDTDNILIQALLQKKFGHMKFSNAKLKKAYQKVAANMAKGKQYKARHILVKTKAKAEKIIQQLNKGANFSKLAKKDSIAPSASNGGELGWFTADTMVPHFAAAIQKLKKGQYTKQPVHTRFGWHVILLQNTRQAKPPTFKQIKPKLKSVLTQQALQKYVNHLRKKAAIKTHLDRISAKSKNLNPPTIKETTGQKPTT